MNVQKAREYFSAYYENTLDPGLRQTLEREFTQNPALLAEYRAFSASVEAINGLRDSYVPMPDDLHEQISRRVDHALWEQKQTKKVGFFQGFWRWGLAGVAAVAVAGSFYAISNKRPESTNVGGPVSRQVAPLELKMENGDITVVASPSQPEEIVFRDAETSEELSRANLDGQRQNSPLTNDNATSRVVEVTLTKDNARKLIVVPGKERSTTLEGTGTIMDLAKSLADVYGAPVDLVTASKGDRTISWKLTGATLKGMQLSTDPGAAVSLSITDTHVLLTEN